MVVILSSYFDVSTYKMLEWLRHYQVRFFIVNDNTRFQGLDISITGQGKKVVVATDPGDLEMEDVRAVWFRRFGFLSWKTFPWPTIISRF